MAKVVRFKLNFIAERLSNLFEINGFVMPSEYTSNPLNIEFENMSEKNDTNSSDGSEVDDKVDETAENDKSLYPTMKYTEVSAPKKQLNRAVEKILLK